jgi:hypothetical protein
MLPHDGDAIAIMGNIVLPRARISILLTLGVNRIHILAALFFNVTA